MSNTTTDSTSCKIPPYSGPPSWWDKLTELMRAHQGDARAAARSLGIEPRFMEYGPPEVGGPAIMWVRGRTWVMLPAVDDTFTEAHDIEEQEAEKRLVDLENRPERIERLTEEERIGGPLAWAWRFVLANHLAFELYPNPNHRDSSRDFAKVVMDRWAHQFAHPELYGE